MVDTTPSVLDRVRRPEYTGENRCVPCTVVNVVLGAAGSALVALVSVPAALGVFVAALVVIYLRGYLVPGTPTLTKRYLPETVRARFGDHHTEETTEWDTVEKLERHRENAVDPEAFLVEEGVIDADTERFTDEFATRWAAMRDDYRDTATDRETLAALFETDPEAVSFRDREYPAIEIDRRIRKWPSEAALLADVATDAALGAWTDRWTTVPVEQRREIATSLRTVSEACPACGGALERSTDTVESCCGVHQVVAVSCSECGDRLLEVDPDEADAKLTR